MSAFTAIAPIIDEFTLFPNLAPELRSDIWRLTFPPPRHIDISPPVFNSYKCPLPATLFVNHESREETLKHYRLLYGSYRGVTARYPLCFDPLADTVLTTLDGAFDHKCFQEWTESLLAQCPDLFDLVKVIEFYNWTIPKFRFSKELVAYLTKKDYNGATAPVFKNLQVLLLTLSNDYLSSYQETISSALARYGRNPLTKAEILDARYERERYFRGVVGRAFESQKHGFVRGKAPLIVVRDYADVSARAISIVWRRPYFGVPMET